MDQITSPLVSNSVAFGGEYHDTVIFLLRPDAPVGVLGEGGYHKELIVHDIDNNFIFPDEVYTVDYAPLRVASLALEYLEELDRPEDEAVLKMLIPWLEARNYEDVSALLLKQMDALVSQAMIAMRNIQNVQREMQRALRSSYTH